LRAVGHVLHKVDASSTPKLREANQRAYEHLRRTHPEPAIYWGFIEEERNVVLKEYAFRVGMRATGTAVSSMWAREPATGTSVEATVGPYGGAQLNFFATGPFAGRSQSHVAAEAVEWWQQYLDSIDAEAA
jgi:hypothetical protein